MVNLQFLYCVCFPNKWHANFWFISLVAVWVKVWLSAFANLPNFLRLTHLSRYKFPKKKKPQDEEEEEATPEIFQKHKRSS